MRVGCRVLVASSGEGAGPLVPLSDNFCVLVGEASRLADSLLTSRRSFRCDSFSLSFGVLPSRFSFLFPLKWVHLGDYRTAVFWHHNHPPVLEEEICFFVRFQGLL